MVAPPPISSLTARSRSPVHVPYAELRDARSRVFDRGPRTRGVPPPAARAARRVNGPPRRAPQVSSSPPAPRDGATPRQARLERPRRGGDRSLVLSPPRRLGAL